jgi:hypothetical protein
MKLSNIFLFRVFLIMGVLMVQNNKAIASNWIESQTAELQLLDKITARISTKSVPVGGGTEFGTLELRVHYCAYRPPEEPPENVVFIMIFDNGYAEKKPKVAQKALKAQKALFSGWMFASSPAISGLEHPVYDVTLLSCHKD